MEWLVGFAGLWVLFQWIIPIALLIAAAVWAMRFARKRNEVQEPTFTSAMPEERDYQEQYQPLGPEATSDHDGHLHLPKRRR